MIKVIGIGNPGRGDDALGWVVAERLSEHAEVVLSAGDPARLIDHWRHADRVVVVDATCCALPTGEISVIDLTAENLEPGTVRSSHGMGLTEAVELSRALGTLPAHLTFVGVEGDRFEVGTGLTPEAAAGAERAVEVIRDWCEREGG